MMFLTADSGNNRALTEEVDSRLETEHHPNIIISQFIVNIKYINQ